ncbi:MAG: carboxylesterase family protein [Firmicutes bacterium]|nr:carboxylesterase family protein [Bacillota bacterium]MBQ9016574.1 carboxylesterase family protein [Bacillota bacterium]
MTKTKKILYPLLILALVVSFTPVLNFAGLGADNAYAAAKLKAPKSVKVKVVSQTALKVSWGKVKGAKGYTVYQKKGGKFKAIKTVKGKTVTVKNLKAGTKYTFYVKAFKKKGKKKVYGKTSKKVTGKTKAAAAAPTAPAAPAKPDPAVTAVCKNGQFVGTKLDSGVISYKGIPYAKAPTGDLRWKAPEAPDASDAVIQAKEFGHPAVQANYPLPDPAQGKEAVSWVFDGSKYTVSEDCLTLNVWTKDNNPAKKKPVMVWFHGGGFVVGSTTNDAYQLENFANNEDMVMVSCNYRLGIFGSADLSAVPEGEKYKTEDFKQSQNLALLDDIRALEWIQENIAAFGGDPGNVTIFGNSAGAADITILTTANNEKIQKGELFQRVIAQSGSLSLCVPDDGAKYTAERTGEIEQLIERVKILGYDVKNLDDLMAVPEETLIQAYTLYPTNKGNLVDVSFYDPTGEEFIAGASLCYDNVYTPVFNDDAGLLPKDPYDLVKAGYGKNIDVLYGTNQNEWNYWIWEMAEFDPMADHPVPLMDADYEDYAFGMIPLQKMAGLMEAIKDDEGLQKNVQDYLQLERVAGLENEYVKERTEAEWKALVSRIYMMPEDAVTEDMIAGFKANEADVWKNTELQNDLVFRAPAAKAAADHAAAGGKGKTYMYYWAKETDQKYQKAGHASEISYVMGNPNHTCFSGTVDPALSKQIQDMWANFARTGDPSTEDVQWVPYEGTNRATMTIDLDNDGAFKTVNNLYDDQLELIQPLLKYHLK